MRYFLLPLVLVGAAALTGDHAPRASARPEFARRESKACGYCHINPRGGGARNQRGLRYARNEFSFPPQTGSLKSFQKERDRDAMVRANKLIDLDHTKAAVAQLNKLLRAVKKDAATRKLVEDKLHELDVRGTEILGQARRMLRGEDKDEGVELLVLLTVEYKDLDVHTDATGDIKDLVREKELKDEIKKEQREAKARMLYLDALMHQLDGNETKALKNFEKVVKGYAGTRAAKLATKRLRGDKNPEAAEEEDTG